MKLKHIIKNVFVVCLLVSQFTNCNKNEEDTEKVIDGDKSGFIHFTLDNKELEISESDGILHVVTAKISGKFNNEFWLLGFTNILSDKYSQISISFADEHPIKEGRYVMIPQNTGYYLALVMAQNGNPNGNMDSYTSVFQDTNPDYRLELNITRFSAKKGEYIEGTFEVQNAMEPYSGAILRSIKNGRFRAKLE